MEALAERKVLNQCLLLLGKFTFLYPCGVYYFFYPSSINCFRYNNKRSIEVLAKFIKFNYYCIPSIIPNLCFIGSAIKPSVDNSQKRNRVSSSKESGMKKKSKDNKKSSGIFHLFDDDFGTLACDIN